ncbi:hypothetical protein EMWEY_00026210 [Eimeria maxima]|uniref:Uncharacterized protein n=1 Tax=Eimeria maxima TaxID=5804 RepID=U6MA75_EIMMA|nr:hypothetical protein EMWEY_00026210 [Eimeria maxima]CDJ59958.1 hypothetical protein EMWEY_00026210 [Eimeria maxima]
MAVSHDTFTHCAAAIDAIFFISVASEHHIALSECHISFWTLYDSTDTCREGCSAVGGARIGLNTFETNNRRDTLTYVLTLSCPHASVTVDSCAVIGDQLFLPHDSLIVLKPSDTPVNLGRFTLRHQETSTSTEHASVQRLHKLACPIIHGVPATNNWICAGYIGWIVLIALAWTLKTTYCDAALKLARGI